MRLQAPHLIALFEAVLVSAIWGSSFVLVKIALNDLGPLTIGGLRFFIGFLILLPWVLNSKKIALTKRQWLHLGLIGLSAYTIGNGAIFWALRYLSATTVSFLMGLTTLLVLFGGILWLGESPTWVQAVGIVVVLGGIAMFFWPGLEPGEPLGMGILLLGMLAFSAFNLLGRRIARGREVGTLALTAFPLAIGGGSMLLIALPLEGLPHASWTVWLLILWLAAVNSALAYVIYNHSLKILTAFEMSVVLNLSPAWTAMMAWALLAERLGVLEVLGILVLIVGIVLVQRRRRVEAPP
jgi:drug/metabolite transporter (DMT)-like permease